jgi:hypothetical protein
VLEVGRGLGFALSWSTVECVISSNLFRLFQIYFWADETGKANASDSLHIFFGRTTWFASSYVRSDISTLKPCLAIWYSLGCRTVVEYKIA